MKPLALMLAFAAMVVSTTAVVMELRDIREQLDRIENELNNRNTKEGNCHE